MGDDNRNVALLRQAYAQWVDCRGEACEGWLDILADDATLSSLAAGSPEVPFTAPRTSRSGIRTYLEDLMRDWTMVSYDMGDFIAEGDRVAAVGQVAWRNKATGKVVETPKVDIWHFRDGKVVAFAEYYDTARTIAAATP
ncbi:MAG: nuclear transport factor 2 family protein [Microvirga sp.]